MCLYKSRFDIKKKDDSQKVRESVYYIRLYGIRKELHAAYNICNRIHYRFYLSRRRLPLLQVVSNKFVLVENIPLCRLLEIMRGKSSALHIQDVR